MYMFKIYPDDLSTIENYKLMSGSVIPRPIAFVTTLSTVNGVVNAAPFSYFNAVSSDPPLLSISIGRNQSQMKDTARNAIENKELVIHICDEQIIGDVDKTGAPLEADQSELALTNLSTIQSDRVSVPSIKEARIRYECKLHQHLPIKNDQGEIVMDFLLVRIVCYHFSEEVFDPEKKYIFSEKLQPVSRLAGNNYASIGESFTVEKRFK
ncbi:flavin reductase family protein [Shimazuella sp. AN120528]|uniref:flavin reductase family protein n=1 Tax=Shimazuella soli TaxID=1892854 RepID=UPI001F0F0D4A|nr:flavin reductase family protein [Shimazuella soli]MCH5585783.1 flavin reductase family protein [Shimazuella soli]